MPFALAIMGLILVVAGSRGMGNIRALRDLLVGDFTGPHNFLVWVFAIGLLGLVGYVPGLQKFSRAMLVLLFVVMLLATRGGFLAKIQQAFANAGSGSGSGGGGSGSQVGDAVAGTLRGLGGIVPAPTQTAPTAQ